LAAQYATVAVISRQQQQDVSSSAQVTVVHMQRDLFDELVAFHQRLAANQQDLPEEAARVLRDNLWNLYD
jgi:hypothetical protein